MDHQELGRFVSWCGRERNVGEVTPAQIADYAQYIGLGGPESVQRLTPVKAFLGYWKEQGWIENGLAAHLRLPRSRRGAGKKSSNSGATTTEGAYLSQEGHDRLVQQLEARKVERIAVIEEIRQAMEDKDFRENAPLDAAKERQAFVESQIRELENSLKTARIMDKKRGQLGQKATVGTKVTLKDVGSGKKLAYRLVDVREADATSGKISTSSPVGLALLDRLVGEEITITVPKGTLHYKVERIDA